MPARARYQAGKGSVAAVARAPQVRRQIGVASATITVEAKVLARVEAYRTGAYHDSIDYDVVDTPSGPEGRVTAGGRKAFYAHIIEWGSVKQPARKILRRAAATAPGRFERGFRERAAGRAD